MGEVQLSFHPAGHVLGSAQLRIEAGGQVWVVSGDYKRALDPTCAPFEPLRSDVFLTEATFGLPVFRWDPTASILEDLLGWWEANREAGRASLVFCHVLGKSQRLLGELALRTERRVFAHGAIAGMCEVYGEAGVKLLPLDRVADTAKGKDFAGELVLAPITARGTTWMRPLRGRGRRAGQRIHAGCAASAGAGAWTGASRCPTTPTGPRCWRPSADRGEPGAGDARVCGAAGPPAPGARLRGRGAGDAVRARPGGDGHRRGKPMRRWIRRIAALLSPSCSPRRWCW